MHFLTELKTVQKSNSLFSESSHGTEISHAFARKILRQVVVFITQAVNTTHLKIFDKISESFDKMPLGLDKEVLWKQASSSALNLL